MLKPKVIHRGREREGRGFSLSELKAAELSKSGARKLGIYVDERRKSSLENNINMLKEFIKKSGKNV
ncbi:MAG: ribosomal protein L13e [Candidatus Aenigmatarchaeota archaeon]